MMSLMASFCTVFFSHEMSWMRSGTELSQYLRVFLPTHDLNHSIASLLPCPNDETGFSLFCVVLLNFG